MAQVDRDLGEVIHSLLVVIPKDEYVLRSRLGTLQELVAYAAPEIMPNLWQEVADALAECIGPPKATWQIQVARWFAETS